MAELVKVQPYFSVAKKAAHVHHDRSDCSIGRWIFSEHLRRGTGGFPRCAQCERLDREGAAPDRSL